MQLGGIHFALHEIALRPYFAPSCLSGLCHLACGKVKAAMVKFAMPKFLLVKFYGVLFGMSNLWEQEAKDPQAIQAQSLSLQQLEMGMPWIGKLLNACPDLQRI